MHMIQNIDVEPLNIYIPKLNILNTSSKMLSFFLSIALPITTEPIPSTIHTVCKSK